MRGLLKGFTAAASPAVVNSEDQNLNGDTEQ